MRLRHLLSDSFHLFYPHNCMGCGSDILGQAEQLCLRCIHALPHTEFEKYPLNPVERIFHGRVSLLAAHSEFYFAKGQLIQALMHQLKYRNNRLIGEWLGHLMGKHLLDSGRFSGIDYLVPLPMFPAKEFKRGYNQATVICSGISGAMQIPVNTRQITRKTATETQTLKNRTERWENVAGSFDCNNEQILQGKTILLVDDVLTTGATLEACAQTILKIPGTRLAIATLAIASK
ncbi:MAG: phosphoribosyltransferase [Ferruginibacter sp.]|nr:phosphoribosyltransferase [Ferruginibacter sp.]